MGPRNPNSTQPLAEEEAEEEERRRLWWWWWWSSRCLNLDSLEVVEVVGGWGEVVVERGGWVAGGGGGLIHCWKTEGGLIQYYEVNGCTLHVKQKAIVLL